MHPGQVTVRTYARTSLVHMRTCCPAVHRMLLLHTFLCHAFRACYMHALSAEYV